MTLLNTSFHCSRALTPALLEWLKAYRAANLTSSDALLRILTVIDDNAEAFAFQRPFDNAEDAQAADDALIAAFNARFASEINAGRILAFSTLMEQMPL